MNSAICADISKNTKQIVLIQSYEVTKLPSYQVTKLPC